MMHPLQRAGWLLTGTLICTVALAGLQGRRVSDVLDELRAEGLTFIYNTQIVPAGLLIEREPRAHQGVELAREILAAHGLALSRAAPGVYAVIVGTAPPESRTAADAMQTPADDTTLEEIVVQTSRYTLAADTVATWAEPERALSFPSGKITFLYG